jgi:hypothetical protein
MTSFISFSKTQNGFVGAVELSTLGSIDNLELLVKNAEKKYSLYIAKMLNVLAKIDSNKNNSKPVYASDVWELGNLAFKLKDDLSKLSLQLDDLYAHLCRDLNIKRKRLEKIIILRRYITNKRILHGLNWGFFDHSTKKKAQLLTSKRIVYGSK